MTIDLRYTPPEHEAVCHRCNRYTATAKPHWCGTIVEAICRRCWPTRKEQP